MLKGWHPHGGTAPPSWHPTTGRRHRAARWRRRTRGLIDAALLVDSTSCGQPNCLAMASRASTALPRAAGLCLAPCRRPVPLAPARSAALARRRSRGAPLTCRAHAGHGHRGWEAAPLGRAWLCAASHVAVRRGALSSLPRPEAPLASLPPPPPPPPPLPPLTRLVPFFALQSIPTATAPHVITITHATMIRTTSMSTVTITATTTAVATATATAKATRTATAAAAGAAAAAGMTTLTAPTCLTPCTACWPGCTTAPA